MEAVDKRPAKCIVQNLRTFLKVKMVHYRSRKSVAHTQSHQTDVCVSPNSIRLSLVFPMV